MKWRYWRHILGLRLLLLSARLMYAKVSLDRIGKDRNQLDYRVFTIEVPVRRGSDGHGS